MTERVAGLVAEILNEREIIINRGTNHGVTVGMRFAVLNSRAANVTDPETGESLGPIELEKTVVKVVRVHERASVARTFRTFYTEGGPLASISAFADIARPGRHDIETLRSEGSKFREELGEDDSYVKRGDPVVQIMGEEFIEDSKPAR